MATGMGQNEKQSLGKFVKSQAKYGTTTTVISKIKATNYVKHTVISTDNLVGLALKYNVTVEQIKRDNRLWTNDSLFLKDYIFIPVTKDNSETLPESAVIVGSDVFAASNSAHKQNGTAHETDARTNRANSCGSALSSNGRSNSVEVQKAQPVKESALDFLSKYDSSIAQLKSSVQKMEQNAADEKSSSKQRSGSSIISSSQRSRSSIFPPRGIPALDPGVEQESEC